MAARCERERKLSAEAGRGAGDHCPTWLRDPTQLLHATNLSKLSFFTQLYW
jgi:hypothetical protein